ncbi:MAG: hypothetical protein KJ698_07135 [Actinobacteria bacterium]|nr:hypothetical protein [Actinomycetota bacterium]MBU1492880.1 hypothetical protein [Actinomycetota bacterium]MBU1865442.1 hypothetical protein [Actinomycetota bacterium]
MFFEPAAHPVGSPTASSTGGRSRLAALSRDLQALERGEIPARLAAASSPAVRFRLAARAIDQGIAARRAEEARRGLAALQERIGRIVADARDARNRVPLSFETEHRSGVEVFWSPVPVLAFRAWAVKDFLCGVYGSWTEPAYRAGCVESGGERFDPAVPHTDGSCGRPPCGIYAARYPEQLVGEWLPRAAGRAVAFGMVAMSGKVVEHTGGYRASHARVAAVVIAWSARILPIDGDDELRALFADPGETLARIERTDPGRFQSCHGDQIEGRVIEFLQSARLVEEASRG